MGLAGFFKALRLLTIVPAPSDDISPRPSILIYFPAVGGLIGLALIAALQPLASAPPGVTATVLVGLWILLTRGFHLDGVGDTADACFAVADRSRRLEIMRDPHVGAFGVAAITVVILAKATALAELESSARPWAMLLAAVYARWLAVLACAAFSYARSDGLGAAYIGKAGAGHVVIATLITAVIASVAPFPPALALAALALATGFGIGLAVSRSLGGITGDVLGAIIEWTEALVLMGWAVWASRT